MSSAVNNKLNQGLASIEKSLTADLRKDAVNAGWPAKIARSLTVTISDGNIVVLYPEEFDDAVGDLEYGGSNSAPSAVFRMFDERHRDEIVSALAESSVDYLIETDVLS